MTLDLNPNPALGETISGLRELLYKYFVDPLVDADYVKINLYDDLGRVRYMVGYTEKFETEIFDVESMAQISMICPDPYLRDVEETILTHPSGWTTVPFAYGGTAETGFQVSIFINSATNILTLANNTVTDDPLSSSFYRGRMIFDRDFFPGDIVTVRTVRGERKAEVLPVAGGPAISIVGSLTPTSPWLELHSQANTMQVYGISTAFLPGAIRELRYIQSYWGI